MVFALYKEGAKMEARHFNELADIALMPKMTIEYFWDRKSRYEAIINQEAPKLPPKPGGPVIQAGSMEAEICMRSVAINMRKFMGYGGR